MTRMDLNSGEWTNLLPSILTVRKNGKQRRYSITAARTTGMNSWYTGKAMKEQVTSGSLSRTSPLPWTHTRILGRKPPCRTNTPDHFPLHQSFLRIHESPNHSPHCQRSDKPLLETLWWWRIRFQQLRGGLLPYRWWQSPMTHWRYLWQRGYWDFRMRECNMCIYSSTQERVVQDFLYLVWWILAWFIFGLFDLISALALGYAIRGYV